MVLDHAHVIQAGAFRERRCRAHGREGTGTRAAKGSEATERKMRS